MVANLIYGWIPKPGTVRRGSGKTGGLAAHLHSRKLAGRPVFTNFETVFGDGILTSAVLRNTPEDLRGAAIGLSEVHQFLESRRTQNTNQIQVGYTISQLRKLRVECHWDSQAVHKVEKRLMDETDILIHCDNLGCRDMDCRDRSCGIETCGIFHYEVFDKHSATFINDYYLNGPREFYSLFDSEEIVLDFTTDPDD